MRKILISALILLLIVMAFVIVFKGVSIGNFSILSVEQIAYENEKLTKEILQTELLEHTTFKAKVDELSRSTTSLSTAKQEYLDLANISSEQQISKASQQEIYTVEFLWTRLGRHATAQGVDLKYDIASGTTGEANVKNILFTVTGRYIPIIDFISAIEDDSDLLFRIENFKMLPSGTNIQTATFVTKNIRIKSESTTTTINNITGSQQTEKQTTTNTTNETTTTSVKDQELKNLNSVDDTVDNIVSNN